MLRELYRHIKEFGKRTDSRLGPTKEIIGGSFTVPIGRQLYRPGMNRRLGYIEALQVISGHFDERVLRMAAPGLMHPYGFAHAYGTKIFQQWPEVVKQLQDNRHTRRAMLYIGGPLDGFEREKPCVQTLQFIIRDNSLDVIAMARSWDAIMGLPYDLMVISALAQATASMVGAANGKVYGFAGSLHYYQKDYDRMMAKGNFESHWPSRFVFPHKEDVLSYREWAIDQLAQFQTEQFFVPKGVTCID